MRRSRTKSSSSAGFTLIEVLVVLAVLAVLTVTALQVFHTYVPRFEMRQAASRAAQLINKARLEAIMGGVTTVVQANVPDRTLTAFAELNDPPTAPVYNPNPLVPEDRTDYLIGTVGLPGKAESGVQFGGPGGGAPPVLVFETTGATRSPGAFRFADAAGVNFLEVAVISVTGNVVIRKYLLAEDSPTGVAGFFAEANETFGENEGPGETIWTWYGKL